MCINVLLILSFDGYDSAVWMHGHDGQLPEDLMSMPCMLIYESCDFVGSTNAIDICLILLNTVLFLLCLGAFNAVKTALGYDIVCLLYVTMDTLFLLSICCYVLVKI